METWEQVLKKDNLIIVKTFKNKSDAVFVKGYTDLEGI